MWQSQSPPEAEVDRLFGGLQSSQTDQVSVPIIADGAVAGYVLAQFTFTMKSDVLRRMSVKPEDFLMDAAFRAIYGGDATALRGSKKQDLQALTAAIKAKANERFGNELVEDVLIGKFNFVPKNEVRNGANLVKSRPEFAR
jgi:hypothetical protein